jgi:hypothetical protein
MTLEVVTDSGLGGVKAAVLGTQVTIREDGTQVYPSKPLARGKLLEDWMREWNYRGQYPMVGFVRPGEMWIPGSIPTDVPSQIGDAANLLQTYMLGDGKLKAMHEVMIGKERYPAVLTKQWPDGTFEVTAFKPNDWGVHKYSLMEYPAVHKSKIFLTTTGENIELPDCLMSLEVCRAAPQSACVFIAGESFLEHLGRASPKVSAGLPRRIVVDCPKTIRPDLAQQLLRQNIMCVQRREQPVEINAHHEELHHFLSGEVRRGNTHASRLQRSWTLQLGPFATHTLRLEKKNHVSPVMTLYVDDEVLLECSSSDIGGSRDEWHGKFSFIGERQMDFRVFEETKDGWPLDSKVELTKSYQYQHVVEVVYPHRAIDSLTDATVTVDGMPFQGLPCIIEEHQGLPNLSVTPSVLMAQFGIEIPKKVAPQDTRGIARQLGSNVVERAGGWVAIREAASQNASRTIEDAGGNFSQFGAKTIEDSGCKFGFSRTIEDVGVNLSRFGQAASKTIEDVGAWFTAWEDSLSQPDADAGPMQGIFRPTTLGRCSSAPSASPQQCSQEQRLGQQRSQAVKV